MKHHSEHILDLYVRHSDQISDERNEIEKHLSHCAGCRAVADDLREFYLLAENSRKQIASHTEPDDALIVQPQYTRSRPLKKVQIPNSISVRLWSFVRRRPVTSSMFMLGFVALCFISINTIQKKFEANPWYYDYSVSNNSVEVFDKNDVKLWEKRVDGVVVSLKDLEKAYSFYRTLIADIDNNGRNEVIILSSLTADSTTSFKPKVFDGRGSLVNTYTIPFQKIQFKSKQYETEFMASSVVFGGNKQKNVFVVYENGRSPVIIVRYDEHGNILGTYWHYGQIISMIFFDVDLDGNDELILSGINDTEDETKRSFATTIIIDPDRMIQNREGSATKGFGYPSSDAELYYIRFPNPEIMQLTTTNLMATNSNKNVDKYLRVLNRSYSEQLSVAVEYFFDSTLTVNEVKFDSQTLNYHKQLYKEGKLTQPINDDYIKSLKEAVQYWNGAHWVNKPTRIGANISLK